MRGARGVAAAALAGALGLATLLGGSAWAQSPSTAPSLAPSPAASAEPCVPTPGVSPAPEASVDPGASAVPSPSPSAPSGSPTPVPSCAPEDPIAAQVDAAFATLTTDEDLVGQLLLLSWDGSSPASARKALAEFRPGGLVYVSNASKAKKATKLNAAIEAAAADLGMIPPIRAVDHEGGIVQRIKDVPNLGSNLDFGNRKPSDRKACERGAEHAQVLREMGFDMDLAPVVDVFTNPANTVIGSRSYGSDPKLVARLAAAYIQGLQGGGIIGSAKHFPGHGDTSVDSHIGLPVVTYGRKRLDKVELVPFVRVMQPDVDVASIMVGHIALPKVDKSRTPASLSRPIVTGLLRDELGWQGLVVTDDMGAMNAITDRYAPGEAAVKAIAAGVDLLIIVRSGTNQEEARDAILAALQDGTLDRAQVEASVKRVLAVKARFGLLDGVRPDPVGCAGG
ncbi:MAG: glycoside hydrolase family 3 N-terminal domain-containing protein [Chloroflexota bacterium]